MKHSAQAAFIKSAKTPPPLEMHLVLLPTAVNGSHLRGRCRLLLGRSSFYATFKGACRTVNLLKVTFLFFSPINILIPHKTQFQLTFPTERPLPQRVIGPRSPSVRAREGLDQ